MVMCVTAAARAGPATAVRPARCASLAAMAASMMIFTRDLRLTEPDSTARRHCRYPEPLVGHRAAVAQYRARRNS
jgi:hypothetical protein